MLKKFLDEVEDLLEAFDKVGLRSIHERRMVVKPLYDFFQKLTLSVGADRCLLNKGSLSSSHLDSRWKSIQSCLSLEGIEISDEWDTLIKQISKIRNKVEHNDEYDPPKKELSHIRERAIEYAEWLLRESTNYFKKTTRYSFKEAFHRLLHSYTVDARMIIGEYGEKTPYIASFGFLMKVEELEYQDLPNLLKSMENVLNQPEEIKEVERSDLENLIRAVRIISILQTREEVLVSNKVCPKCGGKIVKSEKYVGGGTENQPEPDGVYFRVGCKKCDFKLDDEFFSI